MGYVVHETLKRELENIRRIQFFPAILDKIVPIKWELGQPVPKEFIYHEPESYIIDGKHSPTLAAQMGAFFEVILPEVKWFELSKAGGSQFTRIAFKGTLPSKDPAKFGRVGLVELAFANPNSYSWIVLWPSEEGTSGRYVLVREDAHEILREPSGWTLEFKEVERF
jgi:hypothetical protein